MDALVHLEPRHAYRLTETIDAFIVHCLYPLRFQIPTGETDDKRFVVGVVIVHKA
uniref:Uncharacterized protein n=1 Tax=Anopheles christyi TaxID=43041 RepID=A0A182KHX5_9DIPT